PARFDPEIAIEFMTQFVGFLVESSRPFFIARASIKFGDPALRLIDVGLRFDERDGRDGERAVGVDDRIARILPTLVAQPFFCLAQVFDVTIAVEVAIARDPVERRLDIPLDLVEERETALPPGMLSDEDQKERRGVDRAVIGRVWDFTQSGHFAHADFMQYLPRLLFTPFVDQL